MAPKPIDRPIEVTSSKFTTNPARLFVSHCYYLPDYHFDRLHRPFQSVPYRPSPSIPDTNPTTIKLPIPPIPHVRGKHTFHYHGPLLGLLYKSHPPIYHLSEYLSALNCSPYYGYRPSRHRGHGQAKKQHLRPPPIEMSKEWWQAQCAFRGLSTEGAIVHMQARLVECHKSKHHPMPWLSLEKSEMKLKREWERRVEEKEKNGWRDIENDEERCRVAPGEYLKDLFEDKRRMVMVVKMVDEDEEVKRAAWGLGLQVFEVVLSCNHVDENGNENEDTEEDDDDDDGNEKCLVIGRSKKAVMAKVAELTTG
ncbi:MAG: hypothetical protein M1823_004924 [Watsoniomyces obsoletus]|nr:MAG: hypothetical protein M1823_004924 [Watsoniomyces obsoletus]